MLLNLVEDIGPFVRAVDYYAFRLTGKDEDRNPPVIHPHVGHLLLQCTVEV